MTLVLTGQLCSGKNAIQTTRTGHRYPGARFKSWREEACAQLLPQVIRRQTPTPGMPVTLTVTYWPGDVRVRDVSGMLDALMSLLVWVGVLQDDGLIWDVVWKRQGVNRKFPKVIMEVTEWQGDVSDTRRRSHER